jgi:hypothetical protein
MEEGKKGTMEEWNSGRMGFQRPTIPSFQDFQHSKYSWRKE